MITRDQEESYPVINNRDSQWYRGIITWVIKFRATPLWGAHGKRTATSAGGSTAVPPELRRLFQRLGAGTTVNNFFLTSQHRRPLSCEMLCRMNCFSRHKDAIPTGCSDVHGMRVIDYWVVGAAGAVILKLWGCQRHWERVCGSRVLISVDGHPGTRVLKYHGSRVQWYSWYYRYSKTFNTVLVFVFTFYAQFVKFLWVLRDFRLSGKSSENEEHRAGTFVRHRRELLIPVYTIDSIDRIDTRVLMLNRLLSHRYITRLYRDIEKYYRYACIDIYR